MAARPKILLLDDDQDFLDLYREMLTQHLPSLPDVRTAISGARALALLESEPSFNLLIVDLNMPKMDGLQVLSIARRRFPHVRLMVLTGIRDEQFRTRAYAMGVDQYWIKPESDQEVGLLMESVESLLTREAQGGFRGVQSKSLVDIIQLECLSQNSTVLKATNGLVEGKIWIQNGEVIDAEALDLKAEPAFQRILSWKTGSFELLSPDPNHSRAIFTSYQGLLLNSAQALDEEAAAQAQAEPDEAGSERTGAADAPKPSTLLSEISQVSGVEFVLALGTDRTGGNGPFDFWGLENPKPMAEWTRQTLEGFRLLGEELQVGELQQVLGAGTQRKLALASWGDSRLCVGFTPTLPSEQMRELLKGILNKWAS